MDFFQSRSRIIVTCSKHIGPYLHQEIAELGFGGVRTFTTGVELNGTMLDCIRLNLNLRCASQVLYSIRQFGANSPTDIYNVVSAIAWEDILPAEGYVSITSNVSHPTITNTMFANVKVKDAIVDRIRNETGTRPDTGPALTQTVVHLFWRDTIAEVFIDTSGETIAKHGYRKIPGKAPMMESLAAATLLATTWDRHSCLINPMCGSSTIAIEAALLATNRRPGLFRDNYGFMHLQDYKPSYYKQERARLDTQQTNTPSLRIIASDISEDAINISQINAAAAGVAELIDFHVCDFEQTPVPDGDAGVVFLNPEYGDRLGEEIELQATYARIGDFFKKKCRGYTGYVFTGNVELAKKIGLKAKRRVEFYNSKIECRLLEYELYQGSRRPS